MFTTLLLAVAVDTLTLVTRSRDMEVGRQMMEMQVTSLRVSGRCKAVEVLEGKLTSEKGGYVWTYKVACTAP